ncbi:BolA family protein [uncultured Roseobacter sp.]|uniref:BolA family protein n=1 Tax=uncultured Roseobacter sp. TaxID=114847 RepID=UPI002611A52F|nr:BolA family protein [uncultured Roseobacter sp.]
MSRRQQIEDRLRDAFAPERLEVVDDSESHRGHSGYPEGGESHFNVAIRAPQFKEMNRLARHRAIHAALGPQLMAEIHALAIDVSA